MVTDDPSAARTRQPLTRAAISNRIESSYLTCRTHTQTPRRHQILITGLESSRASWEMLRRQRP